MPNRYNEIRLSQDGLTRLDRLLQGFAEYRSDESRYRKEERTYKEELFRHLRGIWDLLHTDPEASHKALTRFISAEDAPTGLLAAFNNLQGGYGLAVRDDFLVYLRNMSVDEYTSMMLQLFESEAAPAARLSQFRRSAKAAYDRLYDEGKFYEGKKVRPSMTLNFAAILLTSYDPDAYILYRSTDYGATAKWLGLTVPSQPEQRYTLFLNIAMYMLAYAQEKRYPVQDLIDVHNMIYLAWKRPEFEKIIHPEPGPVPGDTVYDFIRNQELMFPSWLVTDFFLSLASKPFVILSGISGTGKTKMAQLAADYMSRLSGVEENAAFVSVRPDWTDNSHLLGWYNAIAERYEMTPVLDLLLKASSSPTVPHFIILDEMNIAKVEHYFSDFLSCMESRRIDSDERVRQEPFRLHSHGDDYEAGEGSSLDLGVPSQLDLPLNVYVAGTVNVDESTYMFSPKVLDRANVIEFNDVYLDLDSRAEAAVSEAAGFMLKPDVNLAELLSQYKPARRRQWAELHSVAPTYFDLLLKVHEALRPYHLHFGYRVANEIAVFMLNARKHCVGGDGVLPFAFDLQVLQKILPKMHGNAAQVRGPIDSLTSVLPESCTMSRGKLGRMKVRLDQVGFASFIE